MDDEINTSRNKQFIFAHIIFVIQQLACCQETHFFNKELIPLNLESIFHR